MSSPSGAYGLTILRICAILSSIQPTRGGRLGLPVPQGFTISTEACTKYYEDGRKINDDIQAEIMEYVDKLEAITGKKFGDKENPLLVSSAPAPAPPCPA